MFWGYVASLVVFCNSVCVFDMPELFLSPKKKGGAGGFQHSNGQMASFRNSVAQFLDKQNHKLTISPLKCHLFVNEKHKLKMADEDSKLSYANRVRGSGHIADTSP